MDFYSAWWMGWATRTLPAAIQRLPCGSLVDPVVLRRGVGTLLPNVRNPLRGVLDDLATVSVTTKLGKSSAGRFGPWMGRTERRSKNVVGTLEMPLSAYRVSEVVQGDRQEDQGNANVGMGGA
jgi:hypothetical protein